MLFFNSTIPRVAGLGLSKGQKIGGYALRVNPSTVLADNVAVDSLRSVNNAGWSRSEVGDLGQAAYSTKLRTSWAVKGTTTPLTFQNLRGTLEVQAYINKTAELTTSAPIELDGSSTLELVYL
jgi:hypothetical protein